MEVMVSIVIITGGLLFVMRVYSTAKQAIDRSRALFQYSLLLEEGMFEFEEKGEAEDGRKEKEFEDNKGYFWSSSASPLKEEKGKENPDLNVLALDVFRKKGQGADKYSVAAILRKSKETSP